MDKISEICEKVSKICENENIDFLFIAEGKSRWSIKTNNHLKKVAKFHKETEGTDD